MILDTSAIVAILTAEPGTEDLLRKLAQARSRNVSTTTLVEAALVLSGRIQRDARDLLSDFLQEFEVTTVPFGEPHWREAVRAFLQFGKGRHPAALNFGDCLVYAAARVAEEPILCVGNDFRRTDADLA